jgi:dTDP-4-amino-4,6-dideoxygalactose transaminase
VPHIYVVIIKGLVDRDALRERMGSAGIPTGIHYKPNHLLSLYEAINIVPLTVTESIYPMLMTLPLHPDMSESDVDFVCNKLYSYVQ